MNDETNQILTIPVGEVKDLVAGFNHPMSDEVFVNLLEAMKSTDLMGEDSIPVSLHFVVRSINTNKVLVGYNKFSGVSSLSVSVDKVYPRGEELAYIALILNIKRSLKYVLKAGFEIALATSTLQPVGVSLIDSDSHLKRLVVHYIIYIENKYATESYFEMLEGLNYECEFMDIKEAISLDNIDTYSSLIIPVMTITKDEGETV